jgi:hypothetical protein
VRTNPPTFITIIVAIVLLIVGLSLEGSLFSVTALNGLVADLLRPVGIAANREFAEILIVVAPTLLVLGSLIRGL